MATIRHRWITDRHDHPICHYRCLPRMARHQPASHRHLQRRCLHSFALHDQIVSRGTSEMATVPVVAYESSALRILSCYAIASTYSEYYTQVWLCDPSVTNKNLGRTIAGEAQNPNLRAHLSFIYFQSQVKQRTNQEKQAVTHHGNVGPSSCRE